MTQKIASIEHIGGPYSCVLEIDNTRSYFGRLTKCTSYLRCKTTSSTAYYVNKILKTLNRTALRPTRPERNAWLYYHFSNANFSLCESEAV